MDQVFHTRQMGPTRWALVVSWAAAVAVLGTALPAQAAVPAVSFGPSAADAVAGSYIVRAVPGRLDAVVAELTASGARPGRRIRIIDAVTVSLSARAVQALRHDPRVASVTSNAPVRMLATTYDASQDMYSMTNLTDQTGARSMWSKYTGAGIDVALVDSGVAPVAGLSDTGKVLNGPDLTPESQNPATRYLDTYGHGTHMAGIIAGRDAGAAVTSTNTTSFLGVAPNARIVSVKVADAHGNSDVSQVIAGIDWVVQHAHDPGMNVRVLNLSFGTNSTQSYLVDPLTYAVEIAWRAGIVVVASAGNSGTADGRLTDPAIDPFVISVGADDTNGTAAVADDTVPAFSSRGDGVRNPDLLAPGAHVQSLRVPGSYIDGKFADTGAIDARFFRGSGTSQAAAFVSGSVALMLQKWPNLTPDQVKRTLRSRARLLTGTTTSAQGKGLIGLAGLATAEYPDPTIQTFAQSTGTGSLDLARGDAHLVLGGVALTGERDIMGKPFNAPLMAAAEATGSSWAGGTWNGSSWAGSSWAGSSWAGSSWSGSSWAGSSWSGSSWATGTWTGSSWANTNWSGSSWSGSSWSGSSWSGSSWSGGVWSGETWS